jgi:hypothetical protein
VQNRTLYGAPSPIRNSSGHTLTYTKSPANVTTFDIIIKTIEVPSESGKSVLENASFDLALCDRKSIPGGK